VTKGYTHCSTSYNDHLKAENINVLLSTCVLVETIAGLFWSSNRIDYVLEPPSAVEGLNAVPLSASPHVIHSRYWEAKEFLSFVLRQVGVTSL